MGWRRAGAWLLWWTGCFGLWTLLVGAWDRIDVAAGACAAAAAATIAEASRRASGVDLRVPIERLRAGAGALPAVFTDFAVLTHALVVSARRREIVRGRYVVRPFDAGAKTTPGGAAHRAWTVLLGGYSPNAYVVDIDVDAETVLVHDLVPSRRSETPA